MTSTISRPSAPSLGGAGSADWVDRLARFGLIGKGVLHGVIGLLALQLARNGSSSTEASASGAMQWIADLPAGVPALWVMGFSLLALAVWRAITTFTGDPAEDDDGAHRLVWAAKAIVYGALAAAALRGALDGGSPSGSSDNQQASSAASTVFDWPMGRWIVVLAGLAIIGAAIYHVFTHALGADFADRLSVSDDSPAVTFGRIGYGLRALAYGLVGGLLVQAGLAGEEQRAKGLSGSLDSVADEPWGTALLFAVAVGFAAYGVYCFAESKLRVST